MPNTLIDSEKMRTAARALLQLGKEIKTAAQSLSSIYTDLRLGSKETSDHFVRSLIEDEAGIRELSVQTENLGKILDDTARQYLQAEKRILEMAASPDPFRAMAGCLFHTYADILGFLNLDGAHYKQQIDYREYDTDAAQESLMDQYLSNACTNLLRQDRYSPETWKAASQEERKEILSDFIGALNQILGTDANQQINFTELEETIRGRYDFKTNTVTINLRYLNTDCADSYILMQTMIHEMRHCYQYTACRYPERFLVSDDTLEKWRDNFSDYKTSDTDGYDAYIRQPVELDAKSFAGQKSDLKGRLPS